MSEPLHVLSPGGVALPPRFPPRLRYTEAESVQAYDAWKAQCGPHSLAAACGKSLHDIRTAIIQAGITYKGWMSPTYMCRTLDRLGIAYQLTKGLKTMDLCNGINRVQWEGAWLNPGVPPRIAYFHTHLIAHFDGWVLCTCCENAEWIPAGEWVDFLLNEKPPQPFHITHHWKLERPAP
jgi:hypothetical protein